ncbi:MAG TPA: glycosyltransferase family 2 protein [Ignavibacteria bacterium]|nr:glycosyltransferase family 2 protein [Ignavibacteria bacterium]
MKKISFTIGIPTVNPMYLRFAIESALNQKYDNYNVVILNNASDSVSKKKIKSITESFISEKISYFENMDQLPMVSNWNKLLSYVDSNYFLLLCDDDTIEKDLLAEIYKLILKYPNALIFKSRIKEIGKNGEIISIGESSTEVETDIDFIWHRTVANRAINVSEFIVKTDALKNIGGFTDMYAGWGSDILTWFKLATLSHHVISTSMPLANHRVSEINAGLNSSVNLRLKELKIYTERLKIIISKLIPTDEYQKILLEDIINNMPKHSFDNKMVLLRLRSKTLRMLSIAVLLMREKEYKVPLKIKLKLIIC